jgi:predicted porin
MEIYRMKKSLFAVAALSAVAGAAQAQSSVTVYGLLDMGYVGSNVRTVAGQVTGANNSVQNAVTKTAKSAFGQSAEQTSRLGFKGTEDLGGGTSAFFTVELGLTPQNPNASGAAAATSATSYVSAGATGINTDDGGSAINNRQSFVGLKKNGIGQFAFGRQYTPIFNAGAQTDPGQFNNVIGNVFYVGSTVDANGGTAANSGFTNRASNALTASSDTFAGFQVNGMYALNNTNTTVQTTGTTTGGGNANWNGWGLGVNYTWQKLFVTANYQSFKTQYSNPTTGTSTTIGNFGQDVTTGSYISTVSNTAASTTDKQTYVAATYDFGILKAYAQWVGRKIDQGVTQSATLPAGVQFNRNAQQLGVRSFITPTIESWASIGTGKYRGADTSTGAAATVNFLAWQLGSNYYLSKRTNLYAIYGQAQSTSATSVAGSGSSGNQYAIGVRHTF